uniref:Serpentine Receptor, class H n=1 Tax=Panagrellus redivivus TaxID=6233 RepID=A0A7E4VR16_PANRE
MFIIYVKSPPSMHIYKHILIYELASGFLFDMVYALWQPVLLWPMRAAIPMGLLGNAMPYSMQIMFGSLLVSAALVTVGQTVQIAYRVAETYPKDNFVRNVLCTNVKTVYAFMVILSVPVAGLILVPIVTNINDPNESRRLFGSDFPAVQQLMEKYPSMGGFHPDLSNVAFDILLDGALVLCAGTPVLTVLNVLQFLQRLKVLKETETKEIYDLNIMLLKALLAQSISLLILIMLPLGIFCLTLKTEVIWGSYPASISLIMLAAHGTITSWCILWYITPYRDFILNLFKFSKKPTVKIRIFSAV